MTPEEAKRIIDECREDYHDFDDTERFCIDGYYTLQELEALLVLARDAARTESRG